MRAFLCVCFIAAFSWSAEGQGDINEYCNNVGDFEPCLQPWTCTANISQCYCKGGAPYCRCNNYIDEFYLGSTCSQKWTTLTFALVATLPGLALACVIGVAVHLAHTFGKSSESQRPKTQLVQIPEEDLFPGVVFASDVNSRQGARPLPGPPPAQLPMVAPRPYSVPDKQFGPPMGAPRAQYSAPDNTRPAFDRPPVGPQYNQPPLSPTLNVPDRTGQQPYSYTGGGAPAQVISNPYARARNPYEEPSVYTEPSSPPTSPRPYENQRMAPPPGPPYGAADYRSAFPRAQISRQY
ncbi:uncharacterized protein Hap1MRO34_025980 isoform 1-T1 [Clarias gariepinus]